VLLYEMLTGTWPFRGKTTIDVRHAVLHDPPRPISELRANSNPGSSAKDRRPALEKEPRDRFSKTWMTSGTKLRLVLTGDRAMQPLCPAWFRSHHDTCPAPNPVSRARSLVEIDNAF